MKKRNIALFAIVPALYFFDPSLQINVVDAAETIHDHCTSTSIVETFD